MHDRSSGEEALAPDALSEVLQDLRLSEGTYGRCELTRPWGIDLPPVAQARFHFVVSGVCWLRAPERGWLELHAGDVALLPHGAHHAIAHRARGRVRPLEEMPLEEIGDRVFDMRAGGAGARTILVCCSVSFAQPAVNPLLELMPPLLLVRGGGADDPVLPVLLDAMADEVLRRRVGAATVMTRLADVVITRVVRAWVESRREDTEGWLAAIRDPQIGRALAAIHRRPGDPWSVESLADVARMSRSIFSERFASVVGAPPARYLARWRMHLASGWLRDERVTVAEAASRLGYDSEAAFSRAFKRFSGSPPSAVRRQGRDEVSRAPRAREA
ncbi:AraC family transcriptional regulator [Sorangium sp. So ce1335]|uniref:AraC family transcriptional regulator n=1 Tax=Sorangium sp. So ce1335 TaxID=3133335 RepID=UPI003F617535